MTSDSQNNSPKTPQTAHGGDEVLAQLYKKGAKETPPAKLNSKIINYAANPDKSAEAPKSVGSHFGGGWKVPLSMAASVVVVFALLVQLDQSPQQLELPPIPELSIPTEDSAAKSQPMPDEYNDEHNEELYEVEEAIADDTSSFKNETKESDMDSQNSGALIIDKPVSTEVQSSTDSVQAMPEVNKPNEIKQYKNNNAGKKAEKKVDASQDRTQTQQEHTTIPSKPTSSSSSSISRSKSEEGYAPPKSQAKQKQMQAPAKDDLDSNEPSAASSKSSGTSPEGVVLEKSMNERREVGTTSTDMAADAELVEEMDDGQIQTEAEFAPIPVEDWLLMIERLVAQKDYAEAARQLEKFKQAHPKVNVEDLDAKIP